MSKHTFEVELLGKIDSFQRNMDAAQAKLEKFGAAAAKVGTFLTAAVTLPIVAVGTGAVRAFADIQKLKLGLEAVTGSAAEAEKQFGRLKEIAKLPGLGLEEAAKGTITLQVIGFEAAKAERAMLGFGNAVATVGKGKAEFERAIYGLSQLANTDFPLGEDLNIIKDAIPQVVPLLKEAFGTARTDDLQKLGITSARVVDAIIDGLEKLPPATGGIAGAFENMSDAVKNNAAMLGQEIDKVFDISGLVDTFVAKLDSVMQAFEKLSPEMKKVIIVGAAVAAALGPVLVVIGALTSTAIPLLVAGAKTLVGVLSFAVSPIGAIAIAVGAAVYLIIKYWDEISNYFTAGEGRDIFMNLKVTATKVLDFLQTAFKATTDVVKSIWARFTGFLKAVWDVFGKDIIRTLTFVFAQLKAITDVALSIIGGLFKAAAAVITGDWDGLGKALLDTSKRVWNGILTLIFNVVKTAGDLLGRLFEAVGLEKFGKKLALVNEYVAATVKKALSFDIEADVTPVVAKTVATIEEETVKKKDETKTPAKLTDQQKKTLEIYKDLANALKKNELAFDATFSEKRLKDLGSYQSAIGQLIDNGFSPASKAVADLINKQKQMQILADGYLTRIKGVDAEKLLGLSDIKIKPIKISTKLIGFKPDKELLRWQELLQDFRQNAADILSSGLGDAFASVGEQLGAALAGGGNVIQNLGMSLLGIVGNIAVQLGKAAIGIGVAMTAIKKAFTNPFTAIAAGVALIAIGSMITNRVSKMTQGESGKGGKGGYIPAFANGGIVSGPTMALVGEYAGASNNPEVIAPLNKLKDLLPLDRSGGQVFIPEVRLGNDAIYVAFKRGERDQNRY